MHTESRAAAVGVMIGTFSSGPVLGGAWQWQRNRAWLTLALAVIADEASPEADGRYGCHGESGWCWGRRCVRVAAAVLSWLGLWQLQRDVKPLGQQLASTPLECTG